MTKLKNLKDFQNDPVERQNPDYLYVIEHNMLDYSKYTVLVHLVVQSPATVKLVALGGMTIFPGTLLPRASNPASCSRRVPV